MKLGRTLYRYWAALLFLAVVLQIGLAGYGAFYTAGKVEDEAPIVTHDEFENGWNLHAGLARAPCSAAILLVVRAHRPRRAPVVDARRGACGAIRRCRWRLPRSAPSTAFVGAFHPINALVILGLSGLWLAQRGRSPTSDRSSARCAACASPIVGSGPAGFYAAASLLGRSAPRWTCSTGCRRRGASSAWALRPTIRTSRRSRARSRRPRARPAIASSATSRSDATSRTTDLAGLYDAVIYAFGAQTDRHARRSLARSSMARGRRRSSSPGTTATPISRISPSTCLSSASS